MAWIGARWSKEETARLPDNSAAGKCSLGRSCAAALLVFLAAAARTWFVPACLRCCLLDLGRARRWLQIGLGRIHRAIPVVLPKAGPPSHLGHGVLYKASVGIVCESGENAVSPHRQVPLDIVKANITGVDQTLLVGLLDIAEQFCGVKGQVIVNVAGNNVSRPIDFSGGGGIANPSGIPLNFVVIYSGSLPIALSGGSMSHALLYAPNSDVRDCHEISISRIA